MRLSRLRPFFRITKADIAASLPPWFIKEKPVKIVETPDAKRKRIVEAIKRDIDNIASIYPSVGAAMYDEPKDRLALRIATRMLVGDYHA